MRDQRPKSCYSKFIRRNFKLIKSEKIYMIVVWNPNFTWFVVKLLFKFRSAVKNCYCTARVIRFWMLPHSTAQSKEGSRMINSGWSNASYLSERVTASSVRNKQRNKPFINKNPRGLKTIATMSLVCLCALGWLSLEYHPVCVMKRGSLCCMGVRVYLDMGMKLPPWEHGRV